MDSETSNGGDEHAKVRKVEGFDVEMRRCLDSKLGEDSIIAELDRLVSTYGAELVEAWTDESRYKHNFLHWLAWKGHCNVLGHMFSFDAPHVYSLDAQRAVDGCTALHLAVWYKQDAAYEKLLELGVDPAITNSHGHTAEDMLQFQSKHAEKRAKQCENLIFLDLEFTSGFYEFDLEPKILEAAIVVTDQDLNELASGSWVVGGFKKRELEGLADFHQRNFRDSCDGGPFPPLPGCEGNDLFKEIMSASSTKKDVEQCMLNLVKEFCPQNGCPIVGYSVQCDREVLQKEMPRFYRHLNHQIIDISSIFKVAGVWAPEKMSKREGKSSSYNHRAMNDVRDSIEAMRWIRDELFGDEAHKK